MNNFTTSKSGLFLMEMIFVILLFSLSAVVCLQMFVFARQTVQDAEDLSHATLAARSAAECYQATGGNLDEIATLLAGTATQDTLVVGYDDQWQSTEFQPQYQLTLTTHQNQADITVYQEGSNLPIYTLTVKIPGGDLP